MERTDLRCPYCQEFHSVCTILADRVETDRLAPIGNSTKKLALESRFDEMARWLSGLMPDSREREQCLLRLEEAQLWAEKGCPR